VISAAQGGLTKARVSSCRTAFGSVASKGALGDFPCLHFARNLLECVPKGHQGMVIAARRSAFAQENAGDILSRWDGLAI